MCPMIGLRCYKQNWPYAIGPHLWLDRLFLHFCQSYSTVGDLNFCSPEQNLATFETWIPFRGSCCTLGITKGFSQSHRNAVLLQSHSSHWYTINQLNGSYILSVHHVIRSQNVTHTIWNIVFARVISASAYFTHPYF